MVSDTAAGEGDVVVEVVSCSVRQGDPIQIMPIAGRDATGIEIWHAGEFEDIFCLSGGLVAENNGVLTCTSSTGLRTGLYLVVGVTLRPEEDSPRSSAPPMYRPAQATIFEVVDSESDDDPTRVGDEYRALVKERERKLESGIRDGPIKCGALVFVKDIYMTSRLHGGNFEIIPTEPVGWNTEVLSLQGTLAVLGYPPISIPDQVDQQVREAEPSLVIRFPVVRAHTIDQCAEIAEREAATIINVLALLRGSLGSTFAVIAFDPTVGRVRFRICTPRYAGNLATGWLSGEDPHQLRSDIAAVKSDATLEFYTILLGEALREPRPEFRYVRFWSLLETIGRGRAYVGAPLRAWSGNIRQNRRGTDRSIQDNAVEIVFELARDLLGAHYAPSSFSGGDLTYLEIEDQLAIAYRRRNCVAHGGPCLCRGDSVGSNPDQYERCKNARRDEGVTGDPYLRIVRSIAELVLSRLLGEATP
jgi:hypothetical protein